MDSKAANNVENLEAKYAKTLSQRKIFYQNLTGRSINLLKNGSVETVISQVSEGAEGLLRSLCKENGFAFKLQVKKTKNKSSRKPYMCLINIQFPKRGHRSQAFGIGPNEDRARHEASKVVLKSLVGLGQLS